MQRYEIPVEFDYMSGPQRITGPQRVQAMLGFDPTEPFTIDLTFISEEATEDGTGTPMKNWPDVRWIFSREILHTALIRRAGALGVSAWPQTVAAHNYVYVQLDNGQQSATLRVGWWIIRVFMKVVDEAVPIDEASRYLEEGLDEGLEQLLRDGMGDQ